MNLAICASNAAFTLDGIQTVRRPALGGVGRGGDDQVVSSSGSPLTAYGDEQLGEGSRDGGVVLDNRYRFANHVYELLAVASVRFVGQ